jgi:hypothetical protein
MEEAKVVSMPRIGDPAPSFEAQTTMGPIKFPDDFKGQWVVFFPIRQILPLFALQNLWDLLS